MKHLDPIREKIRSAPIEAPPKPWRLIDTFAIGGLRSVGFDRRSELLLIVSAQGRGVIDASSGSKMARDANEYYEREQYLEAEGIGPLAGTIVKTAGILGGGLPVTTEDMWSLEVVTLDWPVSEVLLFSQGSWLYGSLHGRPDTFVKLASESELRAAGFSYSGKSLVIATSSEVVIFGRGDG